MSHESDPTHDHSGDHQRPEPAPPLATDVPMRPFRTWCCNTPATGPHAHWCPFRATEDNPIDYAGPVVTLPPAADVDWSAALASVPGRLWTIPEPNHVTVIPAGMRLSEQQLAAADTAVEETAKAYDDAFGWIFGNVLGDAFRAAWTLIRPQLEQRLCDCPRDSHDSHHRWNCPATPVWAQTIRDLDTNPWTVITHA